MITKNIKYKDYNGEEIEEKFLFNLNKAELMEMEATIEGGLTGVIKKIAETQDTSSLVQIFKKLILASYGEKSIDGKRFIKINDAGVPLSRGFSETEAYSELFMELATDADAAVEFINGIIPNDLRPEKN